jgi:hypothetical protein
MPAKRVPLAVAPFVLDVALERGSVVAARAEFTAGRAAVEDAFAAPVGRPLRLPFVEFAIDIPRRNRDG